MPAAVHQVAESCDVHDVVGLAALEVQLNARGTEAVCGPCFARFSTALLARSSRC